MAAGPAGEGVVVALPMCARAGVRLLIVLWSAVAAAEAVTLEEALAARVGA
jgi:hypothetical protein